MKLSARNQIKGSVISIKEGAVNASVTLNIGEGNTITSTISLDAVKELGLAIGNEAIAIVKATSVLIGVGNFKLSARNQLKGSVVSIKDGAVNTIVALEIGSGTIISSTISLDAVKELELAVGSEVTAIIKATSVLIATE